jgi:hypothetical protein
MRRTALCHSSIAMPVARRRKRDGHLGFTSWSSVARYLR